MDVQTLVFLLVIVVSVMVGFHWGRGGKKK